MEHTNHENGDPETLHIGIPPEPTPEERAIRLGILAAEANDREIDDGTARRIAALLHGGQTSALYSLASSGNVDEERVYREIGQEFESQRDPYVWEWLNWLGAYCVRRSHKGPIEGWHGTTADRASLAVETSEAQVSSIVEGAADRRRPDGSAVAGGIALDAAEPRSPNKRERISTITVIVMPADEVQPIDRRDIDRGYKAGQQIVGGLIQPVDMPSVEATIWVNEEGLLLGLPFNQRATELLWSNQPEHIGFTALVGDAYITGLPDRRGNTTSVPEVRADEWLQEDRTRRGE